MSSKPGKISEKKLLQEYELLLENLSPNTKTAYLGNLNEFRRFLKSEGKSITAPSVFDLAEFLKYKKSVCKGITLQRKFSAIRKYFLYLKKKKIIGSEDFDFLTEIRPKATKGDEAHRALSEAEIQQCLSKISLPLYRFVFQLGLQFGIRREEYIKIKLNDIDLKRKRLRIHGKGDKVRFIPLTETQVSFFQRFLEQRERDGINHEYLLYSKTGKVLGRTLQHYFTAMSKQSGVKFTSHDLRVTNATRFWNAGMDIYVISKKLGHESIETTLRYVKPTEKQVDERYLQIAEDLSY